MKKWKLSVKEINDYADSIVDKTDIQEKVLNYIESFDFMLKCNTFERPKPSMDFPYTVEFDISETTGHVIGHVYDCEEHKAWQFAYWERLQRSSAMSFEENLNDTTPWPDIKEKFVFDVPLTRGYSDTPKRDDVYVNSDLDMEMAMDEYFAEREGKQKIYPWMLKELMPASDFGISEEEYDMLLQDTLG